MFSSVRNKFLAVLLPLFIVCLGLLSVISYRLSNEQLHEDSEDLAIAMTRQTALTMEKEIGEKEVRLSEAAARPGMRPDADYPRRLSGIAGLVRRSNGVTVAGWLDVTGKGFSDKGAVIDRSTRGYFKQVMSSGNSVQSGMVPSKTTGKPSTILAYPVKDAANKTCAVLFTTIDLDFVSEVVGTFKYMDTGYVYVCDEDGVCIGCKKFPEFIGKLNMLDNNGDLIKVAPEMTAAFKKALETDDSVTEYYANAAGIMSKAVMTPVHLANRKWVVVASAPVPEIEAASDNLLRSMLIVSALTLLVAIVVIAVFAKKLTDPLKDLLDECNRINSGDLREAELVATGRDEVGQLARGFADMRTTMRNLLGNIREKATSVASASEELTSAAHMSAEALNQVASSITEIASGVSEQSKDANAANEVAGGMADNASGIAQRTNGLRDATQTTVQETDGGRAAIREVVGHMDTIFDATSTLQGSIDKLAQGSREIQSIVEMISGLAGQTNLLALNAAIEAARAGEAGRGFAVVATEVRKLAEETESASQKIAALVARNQGDMNDAIQAGQAGGESVNHGRAAVEAADKSFESISHAISELSAGVGEVANGIREMAGQSEIMRSSMDNIQRITTKSNDEAMTVSAATEEQSASMEEVASASRNLAVLASELQDAVSKFRL